MWQRFTERARRVVFFAQEEAGRLGQDHVSTEHLLMGIVRDNDSVAAQLLDSMGISLGRIRSEIERQVARGDGHLGQDMQLTPRAKRVIDLAYDEARQFNNNYIGTEHLLLGLIREGEGLAGRVLAQLGVELERTREELIAFQAAGKTGTDKESSRAERIAVAYGDLGTAQAAEGRSFVEMAQDHLTFLSLVAIFRAKDAHGYRAMSHGDQTMTLISDGTPLKILVPPPGSDGAVTAKGCYVRVLGGDYDGYAGWIFSSAFARTGLDESPFPPPEGEG